MPSDDENSYNSCIEAVFTLSQSAAGNHKLTSCASLLVTYARVLLLLLQTFCS